jgi:hypothetical protein
LQQNRAVAFHFIERAIDIARLEFMGETTAGRVIFAPPGTEPLWV